RERTALGDDDGNPVPLVASLVGSEGEVRRHLDVLGDRACAWQAALPVLGQIRAAESRDDTFGSAGGRDVHARDPRPRIRTAYDEHVGSCRQGQVVDESALPTQKGG